MTEWTILAVVFAALLAAVVAHYRFWVRRLTVHMPYARLEEVVTGDGAVIELRRLAPPPQPTQPPVLLIHGLAANHRNLDAEPGRSLARILSAGGRDVWLVTLRCGRPRARGSQATFATMARHDLPSAVTHVLEKTYADQIDVVGFSMGGMLVYAALGWSVDPSSIRRAAFVGAPGFVSSSRWTAPLPRIARLLLPSLPLRLLARLFAFAADWFPKTPMHRWVYNPLNVARGSAPRALVNLIEDVPSGQAREVAAWSLTEGTVTLEGAPVLERLARLQIPALFVAGAADRLAPPGSVRAAYDAWGANRAPAKRMLTVGAAHGASADYGHGDLVVGRHVVDEVFVPVRSFLEA